MRRFRILTTTFFISLLCANAFGQKTYPFEVQKTGKGEKAIIFIPGFASSGDVWDSTKDKLENDFVCYTLTMAGFAGVKPQTNSTFKSWENAIAAYIKENKIEKPIIIGHSMGGGLALAIASDYPKLIEKIIVVDALPSISALMNPDFKSQENVDCSAMVEQLTAMSDAQFFEMQTMSVPRLVENKEIQETIVEWSVKSDRTTFAEMYCDFSNTDLRQKIENIECPALILLESYFKNMKPIIEKQYQNLKGADLRYADKGLHFIMFDDEEWYFNEINKFLID